MRQRGHLQRLHAGTEPALSFVNSDVEAASPISESNRNILNIQLAHRQSVRLTQHDGMNLYNFPDSIGRFPTAAPLVPAC